MPTDTFGYIPEVYKPGAIFFLSVTQETTLDLWHSERILLAASDLFLKFGVHFVLLLEFGFQIFVFPT